jgi:hypothetical protein
VKNVANVSAGMAPYRYPSVEKALRELAQMPLTEACVSGLCDICLYQTGLCNIVGKNREDSRPSRSSGE